MAGDVSKLQKLRNGVKPSKTVTLGNGNDAFDVKVVLLSSDDMLDIEEQTEEYCNSIGDRANRVVRGNYYNKLLCAMCMRDPDDKTLETPFGTVDDVGKYLDVEDISRVCDAYKDLIVNKSPKIEMITEGELDELKNYLEVTPLKDLSTVLLVHLKSCHQTLVSEK